MLSCLLNNQRINCYDSQYSKEQLKKWAQKEILLCPACGKPYEYCHGRIKSPYFRHMNKELCEEKYSEPETEEHMTGKRDLYEWIKAQPGVTDCELEGWIAVTKQRPDIMFKYNEDQYVLEYQCSPIASEYYERHELYQAAGIKDIWILGTEKYFKSNARKKNIECHAVGYYVAQTKDLILNRYSNFYYCAIKAKEHFQIHKYNTYDVFWGRNLFSYTFNLEIIDSSFDTLSNIDAKKEERQNLKKSSNPERNPNKYLRLQKMKRNWEDEKLVRKIDTMLHQLSNENWSFYTYYSHSKYKSYAYIYVKPRVHVNNIDLGFLNSKRYKLEESFFDCIKVWHLSEQERKLCGTDIQFLKELLLPIMISNKKRLLEASFGDIRILETN